MYCNYCGTENPEDAVFCKGCGKRLDGTAACPACGQVIPADSGFCPYCGVRQGATEKAHAESAAAAAGGVDVKKALKYVSVAAALATAVFPLIFVFLIGMTLPNISVSGAVLVSGKRSLFYYFGDAYKDIDRALAALDGTENGYTAFFESCLRIPAALGTVTVALTLLAVCALSVTAIVFGVRYLLGKSEKTGGAFAIAAFAFYVAGAVTLLSVINCSAKYYDGASALRLEKVAVKFNGATIAGVTLGAVFAATYLGCTVASRGKQLVKADSFIRLILSAVSATVIIVILALCAKPALGFELPEMKAGEGLYVGTLYPLNLVTLMCAEKANYDVIINAEAVAAYSVMAFIMLALTVTLAARMLAGSVKGMAEEGKTNIVSGIMLVVCAVLFAVFTSLAAKELLNSVNYLDKANAWDADSDSGDLAFTYAIPVAVAVLSGVALAVNITQVCLLRKFKPEE